MVVSHSPRVNTSTRAASRGHTPVVWTRGGTRSGRTRKQHAVRVRRPDQPADSGPGEGDRGRGQEDSFFVPAVHGLDCCHPTRAILDSLYMCVRIRAATTRLAPTSSRGDEEGGGRVAWQRRFVGGTHNCTSRWRLCHGEKWGLVRGSEGGGRIARRTIPEGGSLAPSGGEVERGDGWIEQ